MCTSQRKAGRAVVRPALNVYGAFSAKVSAMKRIVTFLLLVVFALVFAGCGSDKDRGVNKDKDKPKAVKDSD